MFAIVPLRIDIKTKSRMSGAMALPERQQLALAMTEDVLAALHESKCVSSVLLVCSEDSVPPYLSDYGAQHVEEPPQGGLNGAIHRALEVAQEQGARECIVLHGDLPRLSSKDIDQLIGQYGDQSTPLKAPAIGLVRCHHGTGTNVVLLSLPTHFQCSFGPDSFAGHLSMASECDLVPLELDCPNAAFDVDTPDDLDALVDGRLSDNHPCRRKTREWLNSKHLPSIKGKPRSTNGETLLNDIQASHVPSRDDITALAETASLPDLMSAAATLRDRHHGRLITYSRKVFLPLTHLCRDVCHYCTFAVPPSRAKSPFMSLDEVLETARRAQELGCKEALFTLGEKPELRYREAQDALDKMGFATTLDYVAEAAAVVLDQTGLLPHINAGCMTKEEIEKLRKVSPSMGLMLESASARLSEKGGPHYGSPDKDPKVRLETMMRAGAARVPFTSGILVGIGETRDEQIDSLFALRELHEEFGHLQEIIIQNFVPKPGTKMAQSAAPSLDDFLWAIAMARLIFGAKMNIQAPPNLNDGNLGALIDAGISDWGGVSPLTPDYVNPESPWPHIDTLADKTADSGKLLQERLTIYPEFALKADVWTDDHVRPAVLSQMDTQGLAREDDWLTGISKELPANIVPMVLHEPAAHNISADIKQRLDDLNAGHIEQMTPEQIARLFGARGDDFSAVCRAADQLRERVSGDEVTFVINRNINYTNMCTYHCQFCAFSKGKRHEDLAGHAYLLSVEEIQERGVEAWQRGGTELCLQGGIHPAFTGETYLGICDAIRDVLPDMHIHAFSPLEVWHGAHSLGLSLEVFLSRLKAAGLNSLPGTAAEILVDDVRNVICHDKINTAEWLQVMETAHGLDIPTTSTIMFGHVETYEDWVRHLLHLRNLQKRTGGFTEFVPLPFVAQEAPIYLKGKARRGPTLRESILMHAVARLVLAPYITNIQTSWVKMGGKGAALCLQAGANDIGGTLMNESITRAAGAKHGQEFTPETLESLIESVGRLPRQRTTLYKPIDSNVPRSA